MNDREEMIFTEALALSSPESRTAFLDRECAGDAGMRQRIEQLLRAHEKASGFLNPPAFDEGDVVTLAPRIDVAPDSVTECATDAAAQSAGTSAARRLPSERAGDTIGRYKLISILGEGGMGTVFLAEQSEPVKRRVALKIIKLGMDTKSVVARFEAERQALALMDHPGIAKVFDAGATDAGRPFFVMELVEGVPITKYCDAQRLGLDARLALFIQVCNALQHAHQKGIIHRDLKPSNILVAQVDGKPVPKVIDFGVAKATGRQLSDATLTEANAFLGTPSYASPEQAGALPDVDTRSDIYTLGVILYELLTGQLPLDPEKLRRAAIDEMLRRIREEDPPKPSTRVAALDAPDQTTISGRRATENRRLANSLRGDLDWVVMKALEKDRTRRYESASSLALDLERHLKSEPVSAAAPSAVYILVKFSRRHRVVLTAAVIITLSLIAGVVVSLWQASVARTAQVLALQEAEVSRTVNDFLQNDVLRQVDSYRQAETKVDVKPNLTVREALDNAAGRVSKRFGNQPRAEAEIRAAIGLSYLGLREGARAVPHLERARDIALTHLGPNHPDTLLSLTILASALMEAGRPIEAVTLYERTLETKRSALGPEHPATLDGMEGLAVAYQVAGRLDDSILMYEQVLALFRRKLPADHLRTVAAKGNLASAYNDIGLHAEAAALHEQVLASQKRNLGAEHPAAIVTRVNLGSAYRMTGRVPEAVALTQEALQLARTRLGTNHPTAFAAVLELGLQYTKAGRIPAGIALLEEAVALRRAKLGPEHPDTLLAMEALGRGYLENGEFAHADEVFQDAFTVIRAKNPPGSSQGASELFVCGAFLLDRGRPAEAEPLLRECLATRERAMPGDPRISTTRKVLGRALTAQKKFAEAEPLLLTAHDGIMERSRKVPGIARLPLKDSIESILQLYTAWEKPTQAAGWQAKLEAWNRQQRPAARP